MKSVSLTTRIGKYEIQAELGRGTFAKVFRAFDPDLERLVAVKVPAGEPEKDLFPYFHRGVAAVAKLRHKNIVSIYEWGEHGNVPFLAVEYVEGETLRSVITNRRPLTLLQKMLIMSQLADAIGCAHGSGAILKIEPANIMLLADGSVKLVDFSAARWTGDGSRPLAEQESVNPKILYASPEQFACPAEVDARSDIFTYAVTYFELLTGQHPFHAADANGVMSRIVNEDPPPARSLLPECPEELERVLRRALQKNRDLRYQSFEDLEFDAEPILANLKRERAKALLAESGRWMGEERYETVQALVREVLELEPANRQARELRETVRVEMERQALRQRLAALLQQADTALSGRQFAEAVLALEAALRLDGTKSDLRARLEETRIALERSETAARLLADAQQQFTQQNLPEALTIASEALQVDPENMAAAQLVESVRREIERRERENTLREALGRAKSLVLIDAYDDAISILTEIEATHPGSPQVAHWLAHSRAQKTKWERGQLLQTELSAARLLMKNLRLAEAVERLEALLLEFGEDAQVQSWLAKARTKQQEQARAHAIEAVLADAMVLADAQDFRAAIETLARGLKSFPGQADLQRVLESTLASEAAFRRQQALDQVVEECEALRQQDRFREALQLVETSLGAYGCEPALVDLQQRLETERQVHERAAAVRRIGEGAQRLIDEGRPDLAIPLLQESSAAYPDERELASALAAAEQAMPGWERRQFLQETQTCVHVLEQRQQWHTALTLLEEALARYPDSAELAEAAGRVRSRHGETERRQKLARRLEVIEQKIAAQTWPQALSSIEACRMEFDDEPELERLLERARAGERRAECDEFIARVQQCLADGEVEQAEQISAEALQRHPEETRLKTLRDEIEREKTHLGDLRQAEVLFGRHRFEEAEAALIELAARKPKDTRVQTLLEAVRLARATEDSKRSYAQGREEAARLIREHRFDQALDLLPGGPLVAQAGAPAVAGDESRPASPTSCAASLPGAESELHTTVPVWVPGLRWNRPAIAAILAFLMVAGGGAALYWSFSRRGSPVVIASTSAVPDASAGAVLARTRESSPPAVPNKPAVQRSPSPPVAVEKTPKRRTAEQEKPVETARQSFDPSRFLRTTGSRPPSKALNDDASPLSASVAAQVPSAPGAPPIAVVPIVAAPPAATPTPRPDLSKAPAPERLRVGGNFQEPKLISGPQPQIPPLAKGRRVSGTVKLEVTIAKDGSVREVTVLSGHPFLISAAREAALRRRYQPATLNGEPLEIKLPVHIVFEPGR